MGTSVGTYDPQDFLKRIAVSSWEASLATCLRFGECTHTWSFIMVVTLLSDMEPGARQ